MSLAPPFYDDEKSAASTDSLVSLHSASSYRGRTGRFHPYRLSIGLLASLAFLSTIVTLKSRLGFSAVPGIALTEWNKPLCTVDRFDKGRWKLKDVPAPKQTSFEDVLALLDSPGKQCTFEEARYLFGMHTPHVHRLSQMMSYEWDAGCALVAPTVVQQLQWLIDQGGLMLVGDSLTRGHFAQLSCTLGHHVVWKMQGAVDHQEASHHLTLNPASPALHLLRLPEHYDMHRPLVSFQRSDLLYSRAELLEMLREQWPSANISFPTIHLVNKLYAIESSRYLEHFRNPYNHYSTLVVSTGAHWTLKTLDAVDYAELFKYFDLSMRNWTESIESQLTRTQRVLVRAATPGHPNCAHTLSPVQRVQPIPDDLYNWPRIPAMNERMRHFVERRQSKRIRWMGGERMTRLRPDAHSSDCLHITLGAGVVENWTKMMWQMLLTGQ